MTCQDRYLWTLPMFHVNGWMFVWIVTAVGGVHVCLRKVDPTNAFRLMRDESVTVLCAAPTVLIGLTNATPEQRGAVPAGVRVVTAGAPPAAATIQRVERELRLEPYPRLRPDRDRPADHRLRTTPRARHAQP